MKRSSRKSVKSGSAKNDFDWTLEYNGFEPAEEGLREALCTLSNGYFGTRGAACESSASRVSYPGTYIAGVFNKLATKIAGKSIYNEDLVNCPNWLPVTFRLSGGEWVSLENSTILSNKQVLNFREGILSREMMISDNRGRKIRVTSLRMVHLTFPHIGAIRYIVEPEDYEGFLYIRSALDGTVENTGVPRYRALRAKHLSPVKEGFTRDGRSYLTVKTTQSNVRIAQASRAALYRDNVRFAPEKVIRKKKNKYVCHQLKVRCEKGRAYRLDKIVAIFTSRDQGVKDPRKEALKAVEKCPSFDTLRKKQEKAWAAVWKNCGFSISAEKDVQKIVNFHAFHLFQTATKHNSNIDAALGARGLHGESYRGHIFWDELFVMPIYDHQMPVVSRALLKYRYERLDKARKYAEENGYRGAMFPWQSGATGEEETQVLHLNPMSGKWGPDYSRNQRHISFAIAQNVWRYWEKTGDRRFMERYGAELFVSIAEFCSSLAVFSEEDGRYHTHGLMGPDEFHEKMPLADDAGYTDNAYSNVFIVWILLKAREFLGGLSSAKRRALIKKCGLRLESIEKWQHIASSMNLIISDEGVISQFEGYFGLKELNWAHYRKKYGNIHRMDRILKAEGKSPNAYKVAKQADVLMLFYVFSLREIKELFAVMGYPFTSKTLEKNYDYYIKRTSHGSTLSKVVHCYLAHIMKRKKEAWNWYLDVLSSDINDIQGGTTPEGIHTGVMGGSLDIILRGFAGIDTGDGAFRLDPDLPANVKKTAFMIEYKGRRLSFEFFKGSLKVKLLKRDSGNSPLSMIVRGKPRKLIAGKEYIFPPGKKVGEVFMAHKKILVIEGDISLGEKLADRLQENDFRARSVSSGEAALETLKEEWVDLVVLSIKLQGEMDGFQVIKTLKGDKELCEIPVVMESDKPGMKDVFEKIGAEGFFVKPCTLSNIIDKIKQILA